MESLLYIGLVSVGAIVGWKVRGFVFLQRLSENPDRVIKMLEAIKEINEKEERGEPIHDGTELKIERIDNTLYAFTKENNEFIAQGPDLNSLLETAKERFPNRVFFGNISHDSPAKELV